MAKKKAETGAAEAPKKAVKKAVKKVKWFIAEAAAKRIKKKENE